MRPAGEIHLSLLKAAHTIRMERAASGQGATLTELIARSCVGYKVARDLVPKLKRRGQLEIVGTRRVPGRNRPVAEYAPAIPKAPVVLTTEDMQGGPGWVDLGNCLQSWTR